MEEESFDFREEAENQSPEMEIEKVLRPKSFDDFADSGMDKNSNKKILGI